jgi:hypothetical protein
MKFQEKPSQPTVLFVMLAAVSNREKKHILSFAEENKHCGSTYVIVFIKFCMQIVLLYLTCLKQIPAVTYCPFW